MFVYSPGCAFFLSSDCHFFPFCFTLLYEFWIDQFAYNSSRVSDLVHSIRFCIGVGTVTGIENVLAHGNTNEVREYQLRCLGGGLKRAAPRCPQAPQGRMQAPPDNQKGSPSKKSCTLGVTSPAGWSHAKGSPSRNSSVVGVASPACWSHYHDFETWMRDGIVSLGQ